MAEHDYASMTKDELYELAQTRDVEGRSEMTKDELVEALERTDLGPDAIDLLVRQHREVEELFTRFEELSGRPSQRKTDLVREMITTLVRHAEIEEQIFYPAVRAEVDDVVDEVDEDLEEHHVVELLLWELDHLSPEAERFDAKVTVLIENVRHHIDEEEQELFPKVREQLDERRRRELGGAMERAWSKTPTRPHPLSPSTPPGNVLAAVPAAVLDRTVGLVRTGLKLVRRG